MTNHPVWEILPNCYIGRNTITLIFLGTVTQMGDKDGTRYLKYLNATKIL